MCRQDPWCWLSLAKSVTYVQQETVSRRKAEGLENGLVACSLLLQRMGSVLSTRGNLPVTPVQSLGASLL